jgi:CheY-like chemotaxis protein
MKAERHAAKFLVVEDSVSARRIFQEMLVRMGVTASNLRMAGTPEEALRIASEWVPDLVFLDLELPMREPAGPKDPPPRGSRTPSLLTGDDLGRELRRLQPDLKFVIVTALDADHPRVAALREGLKADVIVKPIPAAQVLEVLTRLGYFPSR